MTEPKTYTQEELDKELATKTDAIRAELTGERDKLRTLKSEFDGLKSEFTKIQDEKKKVDAEKEKKELESQGKYAEALKKYQDETQKILEERDKRITELSTTVTQFRVDNEIMKSAEISNKPEQVVTLIKAGYEITEKADGTIEIKDRTGVPVLDKTTGKPLDLKGLTNHFLSDNPHLVKAGSDSGGSGSRSGIRGHASASGDFDSRINAARKAGNDHEVIKLKAQRMSEMGPHSQLTVSQTG